MTDPRDESPPIVLLTDSQRGGLVLTCVTALLFLVVVAIAALIDAVA